MTDSIIVDVVTRKLAVLVAVDDAEAMVCQLAALARGDDDSPTASIA